MAAALRHTDPVTKVTILPRGRALGYTMVMPLDDKYSTTRNEMLDQLAYALGGRVAEELVFHDPTTGAANDIEKATGLARKMVTQFGMSERVGRHQARAAAAARSSSAATWATSGTTPRSVAGIVDEEVRRLIEAAHDEAWEILMEHRERARRTWWWRCWSEETLNRAAARRDLRARAQAPAAPGVAVERAPRRLRHPAGADPQRGRRRQRQGQRLAPRRLAPQDEAAAASASTRGRDLVAARPVEPADRGSEG